MGRGVFDRRKWIDRDSWVDDAERGAGCSGGAGIQAGKDYTVRARCARNSTLVQGTLHVHLFSASGGINTTGLQLTAGQLTTNYVNIAPS